jgi:hypothetical protein
VLEQKKLRQAAALQTKLSLLVMFVRPMQIPLSWVALTVLLCSVWQHQQQRGENFLGSLWNVMCRGGVTVPGGISPDVNLTELFDVQFGSDRDGFELFMAE